MLTLPRSPVIRAVNSESAAAELMALQVALCKEPGLLDAGAHTIAVARKPPRDRA